MSTGGRDDAGVTDGRTIIDATVAVTATVTARERRQLHLASSISQEQSQWLDPSSIQVPTSSEEVLQEISC